MVEVRGEVFGEVFSIKNIKQKTLLVLHEKGLVFGNARGRGFEPRLTESESVVLPLDDPRKSVSLLSYLLSFGQRHF